MSVFQKYRWRLLIALGALLSGLAYVFLIEGFLAITKPVQSDVLVIESWFPENLAVLDAAEVIRQGNYRHILCVALDEPSSRGSSGLPVAERTARRLIGLGTDPQIIRVLNIPFENSKRTYTLAAAARDWLKKELPETRAINLFSINVHARKSHILFLKAFPPDYTIGIIASKIPPYPYSRWWLSPKGIYVTVRNTFGYLYAVGFFPPSSTQPVQAARWSR
ncbi:MAG: hypothetical protein IPP19_15270 [Verrucomicrobia bacterium]|nr:hypothetical protein [Verrucomicrobiota bacterium]